jgi:hypothetical protein
LPDAAGLWATGPLAYPARSQPACTGGDDTSVWLGSLEGPIAWAREHGDVHLCSDGLRRKQLGSRESALRYAMRSPRALGSCGAPALR